MQRQSPPPVALVSVLHLSFPHSPQYPVFSLIFTLSNPVGASDTPALLGGGGYFKKIKKIKEGTNEKEEKCK